MTISASKLIHLPVIDPDTHERLGEVADAIFDPDLGKLMAIKVRTAPFASPVLYASALDIQSYESHALLIENNRLIELNQFPKAKNILKEKRPIFHQRVIDQHKNTIGHVDDIIFDDHTGTIAQILVHHIIHKRLFGYQNIVKVTKAAVIIESDDVRVVGKESVAEAETA